MHMRFLIIIFFFVFTSISWSRISQSECRRVDVDESSMGPIRDQGFSAICFAFVAADLMSHDLGQRVSPLATAINHHRYMAQLFPEGSSLGDNARESLRTDQGSGSTANAIAAAHNFSVCTDQSIRSHVAGFWDNQGKIEIGYMNELQAALEQMNSLQLLPENECNQRTTALTSIFGHQNVNQNLDILRTISPSDRWSRLVDENCQKIQTLDSGTISSRKRYVRLSRLSGPESLASVQMNSSLSQGRPISIGYNYSELIQSRGAVSASAARETDHASIIVGRNWNVSKRVCEYKIRNSHGSSCEPPLTEKYRCQGGYFYLDENQLNSVVQTVTWIAPQ